MWYTGMHSITHRYTDIYKEKKPHGESFWGKPNEEMAALCTQTHTGRLGKKNPGRQREEPAWGPLAGAHQRTESQSGWFEKSKERVTEDKFREVAGNKTFLSLTD